MIGRSSRDLQTIGGVGRLFLDRLEGGIEDEGESNDAFSAFWLGEFQTIDDADHTPLNFGITKRRGSNTRI